MDSGRLLRALDLAAGKHRDQRRKDEASSPYINHPIAVATALWEAGVRDESALLAAVLHDTVEDTATTREELAAAFGEDVASVVMEVTDDKTLPKARRKELQVEHGPHLTRAAKLVKLGDKLCNVRDVVNSPPADWSVDRRREYIEWASRVVATIRDAGPEASALAALFDAEAARGMAAL
ncbi:MAG TPA: HD domain-containing protein [Kofleriaceae bacterium]|jgi:guanosine-3',5'-bis(diphosphate) 3'-pyrophosphohydrolase